MLYSGYCCDKCLRTVEYQRACNEWVPNKTSLIAFARKNGWSVGQRILCPQCRKPRKALKRMEDGK